MPDQSSASTEHALIQEITAPLATLPEDPVPETADIDFPIVLRGYDRFAVDAYVKRTTQLVAELQATRSPDAAVRRALERVGEEVSGVLQRAHETSEAITTQSRSEAETRLETARKEAAEITAGAQRRLKELDVETDRIWSERQRIVDDARDLAGQLLALAEAAAERFPPSEEAAAERFPQAEDRRDGPEPAVESPAPEIALQTPESETLAEHETGTFRADDLHEAELEDEPQVHRAEPDAATHGGAEVAPGPRASGPFDFQAHDDVFSEPPEQSEEEARPGAEQTRVMPPLAPRGEQGPTA